LIASYTPASSWNIPQHTSPPCRQNPNLSVDRVQFSSSNSSFHILTTNLSGSSLFRLLYEFVRFHDSSFPRRRPSASSPTLFLLPLLLVASLFVPTCNCCNVLLSHNINLDIVLHSYGQSSTPAVVADGERASSRPISNSFRLNPTFFSYVRLTKLPTFRFPLEKRLLFPISC
jgi:hypothetical protein